MKLIKSIVLSLISFPLNLVAHERWVPHEVKEPINSKIFTYFGMDQISIVVRTILLLAFIYLIWKKKDYLEKILYKILPQKKIGLFIDFFLDKKINNNRLVNLVTIVQRFALRAPALVLIYSASQNSLLMPSYPIHHGLENLFISVQSLFACLILMEFLLPIIGWSLIIICAYLFYAYGWMVGIDALPILGVGYVYITMPPISTKDMLFVRDDQITVMKIIIGLSFFSLGLMKLVNHQLPIGVLDNAPHLIKDILILPFWLGTNSEFSREYWAFGFGASEMLTGILMASGIFQRSISLFVCIVFTKLMIWDFGFPEIPHLFPISILLLMAFAKIYKVQNLGVAHSRRRTDKKLSFVKKVLYTLFPTWKSKLK